MMGQLQEQILERKISLVQETQLRCFQDSWIEEYETRKRLKAALDRISDLEKRLADLEKKFHDHNKYGDWCPHTGR